MTERSFFSQPATAVSSHETYRATRHFGSLDGLRFLCIFAVLWHHHPVRISWGEVSTLFTRGHMGVDFFFILSGFLITTLLLREHDERGHIDLRGFYRRRLVRIVPVYFFVVTMAALWTIGIKGETQYLAKLPYYYLFLSNFLRDHIPLLDPTWSLSMEEQYYMIWPALLIFLRRRWILPVLLVGIAANIAGVMGLLRPLGIVPMATDHLLFRLEGPTYAPILMGSAVAFILHSRRGFAVLSPLLSFRAAPLLMLALLAGTLHYISGPVEGLPNLFLHSVMCLLLVSLVVREDNGMAPLLRLRPIARIGQISYGIYLYHLGALIIVGQSLRQIDSFTSFGIYFVLYFALSLLLAEISFRTLERWFLRFRHKPAEQA